MSEQQTAIDFLEDVRRFDIAMDGPSSDTENAAACAMRDSALAMLREFGVHDPAIAKLIEGLKASDSPSSSAR